MAKEPLIEALRARLGEAVESAGDSFGDPVLALRPSSLLAAMSVLRAAPFSYDVLLDLTCVDYAGSEGRLELVYHLYALGRNARLRLKASVPDSSPVIDSLSSLWKNANWLEREVFDLFGVRFSGHPDLRRLLTYEGFQGHPLRKSYPWRLEQPRLPLRDKD